MLAKALTLLLALTIVSAQNAAPFNDTFSKQLANYSTILMCNPKLIQSWSCLVCNFTTKPQDLKLMNNVLTSIRSMVGYLPDAKKIVVIWKPTSDLINIVTDVTALFIPYPKCLNCWVHTGFFGAYKSLGPQVEAYVKVLLQKYPAATITTVGISLGGALSVLSSLSLQSQNNKVTELYTFGSPRVGNAAFATYVNQKIPTRYRVVYGTDLVPHLPSVKMRYKHNSNEVFFYNQDFTQYRICDNTGEDPPARTQSRHFS